MNKEKNIQDNFDLDGDEVYYEDFTLNKHKLKIQAMLENICNLNEDELSISPIYERAIKLALEKTIIDEEFLKNKTKGQVVHLLLGRTGDYKVVQVEVESELKKEVKEVDMELEKKKNYNFRPLR